MEVAVIVVFAVVIGLAVWARSKNKDEFPTIKNTKDVDDK